MSLEEKANDALSALSHDLAVMLQNEHLAALLLKDIACDMIIIERRLNSALAGRADLHKRYAMRLSPLCDPILLNDPVTETDLAHADKYITSIIHEYDEVMQKYESIKNHMIHPIDD